MASQVDEPVVIPPYHAMLWPTLKAVAALGGSGSVHEIVGKAIELGGYSEQQQGVWHKNGSMSEVAYRLTWARSYLGLVGALEKGRKGRFGAWSITEYGRSLTVADVSQIPARVRAMRPRKRTSLAASGGDRAVNDEPASAIDGLADAAWQEKLLSALQSMRPGAFERLCQQLLREEGFTTVQVTGRSGDGGIDGIGVLRVALISFQVLFQCKRYKGSVGAPIVRDLRGAMSGRTDKGLLITTGAFTPEARREATRDGAFPIELIDGAQLCELLKKHQLGVTTQTVERVTIDASWLNSI